MLEASRPYVPAAGHDWSLPLYDPFVKLIGGDSARKALLDQAALTPGQRVLDIGCGTGTLVTLIKRLHPEVVVVGLDPDPKALARARRKAERAGVSLQLDQGFADELPYPDASFDRVFSSFMLHHLGKQEKVETLRAVRRVLKPDGSFHLLDFGASKAGTDGFLMRLLHFSHRMTDNSDDQILALLSQAGFAQPQSTGHRALLFSHISYYRAAA